MRTLSSTLLAEQRKDSITPFVRVYLKSADGLTEYIWTTADSTRRLYSVVQREEAYGSTTVIQLRNHDNFFNDKNLKGYRVRVGWGAVTSAGNEYSETADFWVISQRDRSEPGELLTELVCIDIWGLLARTEVYTGGKELQGTITKHVGSPICETIVGQTSGAKAVIYAVHGNRNAVHVVQPQGYTGNFRVGETASSPSFSIVISAIYDIGSGGLAPTYDGNFSVFTIIQQMLTPFTTLILDSDDPEGNAQNYKPKYQVNLGTAAREVIIDVLGYTKCGLRMRTDGMHMLYLNPAPTVADYEFDTSHKFVEERRDRALVTPNRIVVTNEVAGEVYVGYAEDTDSYNSLGKWLTRIVRITSVGSDADATARANALLARTKADVNAGNVTVPVMNCGQEIYDWVKITDARNANIIVQGRVGAIERRFAPGRYEMLIRLGGLFTSADVDIEGSPESNIQVAPAPPAKHTPFVIHPANLAPGAQPYICDIRFTSVDWDTVSWTAGTVKVKSGDTLSIAAGSKDLLNDNPYYAYFIWGNNTLQWTQSYGDTIGENRGLIGVAKRGTSTTDKAYVQNFFTDSILINRDKVMNELVTELQLAANAVTEAKIAVAAVTGPKLAEAAVTAEKLAAEAVTEVKIASAAVTEAKIAAEAVTGPKIAASAVDATKIQAGAVIAEKIAAGAVVTEKIAAGAVNADKIAANAVTAAKIAAGAVEADKIAANAVTADKIAANAVTAGKIQAEAVTSDKIAARAITAAKIDTGAIEASKLAAELVLSSIIWAGANRVKLDWNGIQVWGRTLRYHDEYGNYVGDIFCDPSGMHVLLATGKYLDIQSTRSFRVVVHSPTEASEINTGHYYLVTRALRPAGAYPLGSSTYKWSDFHRLNEFTCPLPTTNSALRVIRKIKEPKLGSGDYGHRHYFNPEDFPDEMKHAPQKYTEDGVPIEGEYDAPDIELTRVIGVLVQAVRELTEKVDALEKKLAGGGNK